MVRQAHHDIRMTNVMVRFDKVTMTFVILSSSKDAEGEEKFVYFVMR